MARGDTSVSCNNSASRQPTSPLKSISISTPKNQSLYLSLNVNIRKFRSQKHDDHLTLIKRRISPRPCSSLHLIFAAFVFGIECDGIWMNWICSDWRLCRSSWIPIQATSGRSREFDAIPYPRYRTELSQNFSFHPFLALIWLCAHFLPLIWLCIPDF